MPRSKLARWGLLRRSQAILVMMVSPRAKGRNFIRIVDDDLAQYVSPHRADALNQGFLIRGHPDFQRRVRLDNAGAAAAIPDGRASSEQRLQMFRKSLNNL